MVGATEVLSLEMTIGQLIAFNMMTNHIAQPLARMVELWGQFIQTRVAIEKLGDMLNLPVEQHTGSDNVTISGAISFKNILFRYQPDIPPTINDLSLDIRAGETLGWSAPRAQAKAPSPVCCCDFIALSKAVLPLTAFHSITSMFNSSDSEWVWYCKRTFISQKRE